jgi:amino acid transporter
MKFSEQIPTSSSEIAQNALPSETLVPRVMPRILGTRDMTAMFVVSIYLASCATTAAAVGPAAITYLLLAAITFFVPCLIATAQLGSLFPYEGALYNWTHRLIGGYWSFFSGFCAWFPCVLIASSLADLFVSYTQVLFHTGLTEPWQQGLAICAILIIGGFVSTWRFRLVQNLINVLVGLILVGTTLIGLSAVIWLVEGHYSATNLANWPAWNVGPGNFAMFGLLVFAYIGTEGPLNLAGEITGSHVIKRHLLWGGVLILVIYLFNTFAVLAVQGPSAANNPLAMVDIVETVLGKVPAYITALCLMGSFFATILVYNYVYARLLMVAGIDRRLPRAACKLNKHQVPANAIIFQTALAVGFTIFAFIIAPLAAINGSAADFSSEIYNVSQAAAALVWTISAAFLFIDLVACYLRDRQYFWQHRILPMPILWFSIISGLGSCFLTIIDTLLFSWTPLIPNMHWWYLVGSLTLIFLIISAFSSILARSEAAWEEIRSALGDTQKEKAYRQ